MEDKKYPIYKIRATWDQEGKEPYTNNCSGGNYMYKEKLSEKQIQSEIDKYEKTLHEKYKEKDTIVKNLKVTVTFYEESTWCLLWFQHSTFNTHLSDDELKLSFEKFVQEKEKLPNTEYCLMGASDRWRWKDPCRCEHCEKKGVVIIDH